MGGLRFPGGCWLKVRLKNPIALVLVAAAGVWLRAVGKNRSRSRMAKVRLRVK